MTYGTISNGAGVTSGAVKLADVTPAAGSAGGDPRVADPRLYAHPAGRRDGTVDRSPPARRRLVGGALRRYRQHAGYVLGDAARLLDCHTSKVSRIETGQRGIRRKELRELLAGYGVGEPEQAALAALARPAGADAWWREYADVLAPAFREFLALEMAASEILIWHPHQVPDLLQTAGYATAAGGPGPAVGAAGARGMLAAVTLARQRAVLKERQPELAAVIGEAALRQMPGGPEVARGQLRALAEACESPLRVTVQVLPSASATHAASGSAPVTILGFGGTPGPSAVWLAGPGQTGVCLVDQADTACYARALAQLARYALPRPNRRGCSGTWPQTDRRGHDAAGRTHRAGPDRSDRHASRVHRRDERQGPSIGASAARDQAGCVRSCLGRMMGS